MCFVGFVVVIFFESCFHFLCKYHIYKFLYVFDTATMTSCITDCTTKDCVYILQNMYIYN